MNDKYSDLLKGHLDDDREKEREKYIENVLLNASDSIEAAKKELEEKERVKTYLREHKEDMKEPQETQRCGPPEANRRFIIAAVSFMTAAVIIQFVTAFAAKTDTALVTGIICSVLVLLVGFTVRSYSLFAMSAVITAAVICIMSDAVSRGLPEKDRGRYTLMQVYALNEHYPKKSVSEKIDEKKLHDALQGKFIYYYHYGCTDCFAVHKTLMDKLKEEKCEVIMVDTKTEFGKQLLEIYPVANVPSGLVVSEDSHKSAMLYSRSKETGEKCTGLYGEDVWFDEKNYDSLIKFLKTTETVEWDGTMEAESDSWRYRT